MARGKDKVAPVPAVDLGDFEGSTIYGVAIEIRNAGGGLNRKLALDPTIFHKGDRVTLAVTGTIDDFKFPPFDKEDPAGPCLRIGIMSADDTAILTGDALDAAHKVLDDENARLEAAEREAAIRQQDAEQEAAKAKGVEPMIGKGAVNPEAVPPAEHQVDEVATARAAKKAPAKKAPAKKAPAKKRAPVKRSPAKKSTGSKQVTPRLKAPK